MQEERPKTFGEGLGFIRALYGSAATLALLSSSALLADDLSHTDFPLDVSTDVTYASGLGPEIQVLLRNPTKDPLWFNVWFGFPGRRDTCKPTHAYEELEIRTVEFLTGMGYYSDTTGLVLPGSWNHRVALLMAHGGAPPCNLLIRVAVGLKSGYLGTTKTLVVPLVTNDSALEYVAIPTDSPPRVRVNGVVEKPMAHADIYEPQIGAPDRLVRQPAIDTFFVRLLVEDIGTVDGAAIAIADRGLICPRNTAIPHWRLFWSGLPGIEAGPYWIGAGDWRVFVQTINVSHGSRPDCEAWFDLVFRAQDEGWQPLKRVTVDLSSATDYFR